MNVRAVRFLGSAALLIGLIIGPGLGRVAWGEPSATARGIVYPIARRGDQVDEYHGIKVADPYRWMEDIDSPATRVWVEAQAKVTSDYLASIPGRDRIAQRLREIWNYERWGRAGEAREAVVLHCTMTACKISRCCSLPPIRIDRALSCSIPNALSKDGTIAFKGAGYSDDGRLMAYGLSEAGSDWEVWRVRDIATGKDLPDEIRRAKFTSASWRKDGSGFFYSGYSAALGRRIAQGAEPVPHAVLSRARHAAVARSARSMRAPTIPTGTSPDRSRTTASYLIVTASHGTDVRNTLLVADLQPGMPRLKADHCGAARELSPSSAISGRRCTCKPTTMRRATASSRSIWRNPNLHTGARWCRSPQDTLDSATLVGEQLIAQYLHDAHSAVRRLRAGRQAARRGAVAGIGHDVGLRRAARGRGHLLHIHGLHGAGIDLSSRPQERPQRAVANAALAAFKPAEYETQQVFYSSKDGTRDTDVRHRTQGNALDGNNPTILYGYGGFNHSLASRRFRPALPPGSSSAACMQSRICGAAESTDVPGTRRE